MVSQPDSKSKHKQLFIVRDIASEMFNRGEDSERLLKAMDLVVGECVNVADRTVASKDKTYTLSSESGCSCPDVQFNSDHCKHEMALEIAIETAKRLGETEMADEQPVFDDIPDPIVPSAPRSEPSGFTDYPSTLCLKRTIGRTELMWTFRGTDDGSVWERATRHMRAIDEIAHRYATEPVQQAAPVQAAAPALESHADPAGPVPMCPKHQRELRPSKFDNGGWYCTGRNEDGSYCGYKVS